jgi:ATP adenylyltransferase
MDRLFTPWRLAYVTEASIMTPECIFCDALARIDEEPLVVRRGQRAFVILNKFPYNNGHVMVVPHRHAGRLAELEPDELAEMMALTQSVERALTDLYRPHGFNVGLNIGKPAGAGVLDHLHLHVVPRWNGDTSFMTVFGETRVLPEELAATAARLKAALAVPVPSGGQRA